MYNIYKIDISEKNRGKKQTIIDIKFKYNFSKLKKYKTKIYRCTEYKTLNKCKSFIILNDNKIKVLNKIKCTYPKIKI